jgi:hypothetical protein
VLLVNSGCCLVNVFAARKLKHAAVNGWSVLIGVSQYNHLHLLVPVNGCLVQLQECCKMAHLAWQCLDAGVSSSISCSSTVLLVGYAMRSAAVFGSHGP